MRLSLNKRFVYRISYIVYRTAGCKLILFAACGIFFAACLFGCSKKPLPKVHIQKLKNNHYQLIVDGKPYVVRGVCYNPVPIGESHEYDWWNDPARPWITDGRLMREMGINTVRIYQLTKDTAAVKRVIDDFYRLYGIRTILGSWMGYWEFPCPLYGDKAFEEKVGAEVSGMVEAYKNEPGVLMWVLGNENNYSCLGRVNPWSTPEIDKEPDPQKKNAMRYKVYYSFVNRMAQKIHKLDIGHPVALGNGELTGLEAAKDYCPDIDLVACIIYRGKTFGPLFRSLRMTFDRPILLVEIGADCYDAYLKKEDQNMQAFFLESQWRQIYQNLAGSADGEGNCIGGVIFEWTDEWWKHNEYNPEGRQAHDTQSNWSSGSYYFDIKAEGNMNMNEEWFGIVALSEAEENGLNKRIPRKAYYVLREFWKNPAKKSNGSTSLTIGHERSHGAK